MSICRTVYRATVLRRSRPLLTLRAQKADHYMLRVRMKMRSDAYASSRQNTDYAGAGGWSGVWAPGSNIEGPACLTSVCVQADLSRCLLG
jgi:hypothetical protein